MSHRPPVPSPHARSLAAWVAIGSVCLIVYGSLFPFVFGDNGRSFVETALDLTFRRTTRGDIIANLLLYVPLGLGLVPLLRSRRGRIVSVLCATACGLALSLAIEVLQAYTVSRVSSLTDLLLNGVSAFAGALAALLIDRFAHVLRIRGAPRAAADPSALVVLVFWFCFRLAPFVPTIDWQKYKNALKPLAASADLQPLLVLSYIVGWLVADYALRRSFKGVNPWAAFVLSAAVVLLGRIVIVDKALAPAELLALPLCLPLAAWLARAADRRHAITLAYATVAIVVLRGLEPFTLSPVATDFSWLPFRNSLTGNLELGYTVLFEKAFWYTTVIWLCTRAGMRLATTAALAVVLLAAIEVAQKWLPGRSPEITDPLLALGFAVLLSALLRGLPPHTASGSTSPPERAR